MRDAVNIRELHFKYNGEVCKVIDFWIAENNELYASLLINKTYINMRASELKNYLIK
jgi:hypothetical protein